MPRRARVVSVATGALDSTALVSSVLQPAVQFQRQLERQLAPIANSSINTLVDATATDVIRRLRTGVSAALMPPLDNVSWKFASTLTVPTDFIQAPRLLTAQVVEFTSTVSAVVQNALAVWRWAEQLPLGSRLWDLGRRGLAAARRARDAVLRGDLDVVGDFLRTWLDLKPSSTMLDAVAAALLEDDWAVPGAPDEGAATLPLDWLRKRTLQEHRVHRPVWETTLRDLPVMLMGPYRRPDGQTVDPAEALADPNSAAEFVAIEGYDDDRLNRVLGRLCPEERAVVAAYANGTPHWGQAALVAGRPAAFGDQVRRRAQHHRDNVLAQLNQPANSPAGRG